MKRTASQVTKNALVLVGLTLGACASSHNLREGHNFFGGGYQDYPLRPGLHYIRVQSNYFPVILPSAAKATWDERAKTLCGSSSYTELQTADSAHPLVPVDRPGVNPNYVAVRDGYVLCASAKLSPSEAIAVIEAATK